MSDAGMQGCIAQSKCRVRRVKGRGTRQRIKTAGEGPRHTRVRV